MTSVASRRTRIQAGKGAFAERLARWTVFAYIDLWVLEGALRKWLPGLGDIGYFARDALILGVLVLLAILPRSRGRSAWWLWVYVLMLVAVGSFQVMAELISLPVMLVGLRSYVAIALLPALVWQFRHVLSLGEFSSRIMFHLPLQAVIIVAQVVSPPNAPINWQVTTDSAGFINFGVVRATGTFSAPSGLGAYLGIAAAVALIQVLSSRKRRARVATLCVAIAFFCAALGGDRSTLITIVATAGVFALSLLFASPRQRGPVGGRILPLIAIVGVAGVIVFSLFSTVIDSFFRRFENAAQAEDPIERVFRQSFGFATAQPHTALQSPQGAGLLGDGMAAHSQAGIALGSPYGWVEIEVTRWVAELGVVGYAMGWARILIAVFLIIASLRALARGNVALPTFSFLLVSVMIPGLITQTPSTQAAFGVMVAMIMLGWCSRGTSEDAEPEPILARHRRGTASS